MYRNGYGNKVQVKDTLINNINIIYIFVCANKLYFSKRLEFHIHIIYFNSGHSQDSKFS